MRRFALVALGTLLLAGCASHVQPSHSSPSSPAPRQVAAPKSCPKPELTGPAVLAPDPVSVFICLSGEPPEKAAHLPGMTLPAADAVNLARTVDAAPSADMAQIHRCRPKPGSLVVVLRFRYAGSKLQDAVEQPAICTVVFVGGHGYRVPRSVAEFLSYISGPPPGRHRAMPDLVGRTVPEAVAAGRAAQFGVEVDAIAPLSGAPPWTVILQVPVDAHTISVIATPPPRDGPCRADQLRLQYFPAAPENSSQDASGLVLTNRSGSWCTLAGPVAIVGLDSSGSTVTKQVHATLRKPVDLSPDAAPIRLGVGVPAGVVAAGFRIESIIHPQDYTPDHTCPRSSWVTPKTWRIELPTGTLTVANGAGFAGRDPGEHGFVTCRGEFSAGMLDE